jgi:hypothetical protein
MPDVEQLIGALGAASRKRAALHAQRKNHQMKTLNRLSLLFVLACAGAFAQTNTLIQTSLSSAITATQQTFNIASVTSITASLSTSTVLYVDKELMLVNTVAGSSTTSVNVERGYNGTLAVAHINTSVVLAGRPDWFLNSDPTGACTVANTYVTPYVSVLTGYQWLCSSVTLSWVPGFNNTSRPAGVTTLVASAAGQVTPSGPLFHINGTAAITGFLYPIGLGAGQPASSFCVIPDAAFTTTATNNIAIASTGVLNKTICWTWDYTNLKYTASY